MILFMIKKGTIVRIKTTNGGETIGRLLEDYRPTYDVVYTCDTNRWSYAIIPTWRIKSVEEYNGN